MVNSYHPIQSATIHSHLIKKQKQIQKGNNRFSTHFQHALESSKRLAVSKHAKKRLMERGIEISESRWEEIETKIREAKKKGVNDSLVLLNDAALIVSVKNHTVITALDRKEASSQIFTNINGTIIME